MSGWSPPRPERAPVEWQQEPARPLPAMPERDLADLAALSAPAPRARRRRRRLVPTRSRIAVLFAVLAVAIAAIAGLGTALTPRYGGLEPYGTTPVADLRTKPVPDGWSTNLARKVVPGVPVRCVGFNSTQSTGRYVVVTGTTPPLGSTSQCSQASLAQVESSVALLDSDTGHVLWTTDLSKRFPSRSGSVVLDDEIVAPEASRVIVMLTVDEVVTFASLSMQTGDVLSSTALDAGDSADTPTVSGHLVLFGGSVGHDGATQWTLANVAHVDQPTWSAVVADSDPPILTSSAAFAVVDGRSVRIDGTTGRVTRLGDGHVDLSSSLSDQAGLVSSENLSSGIVLTAWDDAGHVEWTRSGAGTLAGLTRDCVMTALPGSYRGSCVDRATGRTRWTADIQTGSFAYSIPGQTTNQVMVYRNKGNSTELDFFDGDTGKLLFPLELPPVSFTAVSSRTTGYLQVSSDSGTPTDITAFDAASGRELWTLPEAATRDTSFWGGQLVRITKDGVATQLVDRPHVVLGE